MLGINGPMNANQIMNILNQNVMIKYITYSLIQNPMIINQMLNIINSLAYNPVLMNEIKNLMNQDLYMMNMMNMNMGLLNMNNNMNPMMNNMENNMELNQQKPQNIINIIFKKSTIEGLKNCPIQCQFDEKISDIIKKYKIIYNDNEEHLKFIYNARILNPSLTVAEAGLIGNSSIAIVNGTEMVGGQSKNNK